MPRPGRSDLAEQACFSQKHALEHSPEAQSPSVGSQSKQAMPPKKSKSSSSSSSSAPLLGRPTNNVSIGIVGLPNVGKSTFFNIMAAMNVAAENYPFCTIDPSDAKVPVPVSRPPSCGHCTLCPRSLLQTRCALL